MTAPPIEYRSAAVADVSFPDRTITVLAVPYEQTTDKVVYKGRNYAESFARGAFNGISTRQMSQQEKTMVRREHTGPTIGKVTKWTEGTDALFCEIRVAQTSLGDETLQLTHERMLYPSVGFYLKRLSDQELNHRSDPARRYIRRAFVEHVAMTDAPAYDGVDIVDVRSAATDPVTDSERVTTPRLDEWLEFLSMRRAGLNA